MIKATNIVKKYGDLEVLKNVSLEIAEREVVSIVGASGAGKTTLLQILGTLEKSTEPKKFDTEILINGQDVTKLSDRELSRFRNENIGFIFQFHQLLPEFTALENICIPAFIRKTNKTDAEKKS
jgi:ABC-type antimicrobial peptide transport system, ATPase component